MQKRTTLMKRIGTNSLSFVYLFVIVLLAQYGILNMLKQESKQMQ